jgi:hypothetical protein
MTTPTAINLGTKTRSRSPRVKIYARVKWDEPWTEIPYLWCKSLEFAASPSMPEAILEWDYGYIRQAGQPSKEFYAPLSIIDYYVKIVIDPDQESDCDTNDIRPWYGRVVDVVDGRAGTVRRNSVVATKGRQTFVCWGMESDLESIVLDRSIVKTTSGIAEIGRAIAFNCGAGRQRDYGEACTSGQVVGNRSKDIGRDGVYLFTSDLSDAAAWTAFDILEYLCRYFGPRDGKGNVLQRWFVDPDFESQFLKSYTPKLHVEGLTLKKVIDNLIDRRRGVLWRSDVYEWVDIDAPDDCLIQAFTQVEKDISLETGEQIKGNKHPESLDVDASLWPQKLTVRQSEVTRFDQVVVRGQPIGAVFTLSSARGGIVADWTDGDKATYQNAAKNEPGYAALDRSQKQLRNDNFRMQSYGKLGEQLQRVYSYFKIPDDWDGTINPTDPGGEKINAILKQHHSMFFGLNTQIEWGLGAKFWRTGLKFEKQLPLYEHEDYSGLRARMQLISENGAKSELMKPLVIFKITEDGKTYHQYADKLSGYDVIESADEGGRGYSCSHHVRDDVAGMVLRVSGTAAQHKIAKNDFTPADDTDDIPTDLDWKDEMLATMYMLTDQSAEVRIPFDTSIEADPAFDGKRVRRLYISVPHARLDYIVKGTIVGLRDGVPQICEDNAVLRSDVGRLSAIASLAFLWYCRPRKTVNLQYKRIRKLTEVGHLITSITQGETVENVQTVVTRVRYDLDGQTTTVQTHFDELDLKAM